MSSEIELLKKEIEDLKSKLETAQLKKDRVLENMVEGVVVQNNSGAIIDFNPAALRVLGLTEDQILGRKSADPRWRAILPDGTDFPGEDHPSMQVIRTGKPVNNFRMGIETPDGELRWLLVNAVPVRAEDGINAVSTFQDITETVLQNNKLKETTEYLDLAVTGAGLGIWDWWLEDNSVKFDKQWAEMLGLNIDEITMELQTWESRVHPDDLEQCYADIKAYMNGETDSYENIHRMKHADGHWVYILDKGRFSDWDNEGNPIRFTGTHLDVTASKERELELELSLKNNKAGLWKFYPQTNELIWDEGMMQIYDVDINNFEGTYQTWVNSLHPNFKETAINEFTECFESKSNLFESNFTIILSSGDEKHIGARAIIERDPEGNPIKFTGLNWDRTDEQKRIDKIEEQTRINQHQMKLASIGELAAGVGHEINNPLAIIKGYLASVKSRIKEETTIQNMSKYFDKMDIAIDRIAQIVRGLRTFSRSDSENKENFPPLEALSESLELIREIYAKEEIEVIFENNISSPKVMTFGHRGQFQQVIMNLLSNAKDAVLAVNDEKKIKVAISNIAKKEIYISITDNGVGIKDDVIERIFDPFFTTKPVNKGTGIGLSLVHTTVTEMKGNITVDSQVGKGTTFKITIPLSETETETSQSVSNPKVSQEKPLSSVNVLIVDDEEDIREIVADMIEDSVGSIDFAKDGASALDMIEKKPNKYQVILSDYTMPGINGDELCEKIKSHSHMQMTQFILLTGGVKKGTAEKLESPDSPIDKVLYKPFQSEDILKAISEFIESTKLNIAG